MLMEYYIKNYLIRRLGIFIFILSIVFNISAVAQELISSGGGENISGASSLSWSIGEPVTETFYGANNTLTQGFQQSNLTINSIYEMANLPFSINAFPNPASDFIQLQIGCNTVTGLNYQLFDTNGKLMTSIKLENFETEISLKNLPPSVYYLKITEKGKPIKSFKIIKK
jgi:hypothetical protein